MTITLSTEALTKTYQRKLRKPGLGAAFRGLFSSEEESVHAVSRHV